MPEVSIWRITQAVFRLACLRTRAAAPLPRPRSCDLPEQHSWRRPVPGGAATSPGRTLGPRARGAGALLGRPGADDCRDQVPGVGARDGAAPRFRARSVSPPCGRLSCDLARRTSRGFIRWLRPPAVRRSVAWAITRSSRADRPGFAWKCHRVSPCGGSDDSYDLQT